MNADECSSRNLPICVHLRSSAVPPFGPLWPSVSPCSPCCFGGPSRAGFGWLEAWVTRFHRTTGEQGRVSAARGYKEETKMLRSVHEWKGFTIQATDGEIGHVDQFFFDDEHWTIRYLVVDT